MPVHVVLSAIAMPMLSILTLLLSSVATQLSCTPPYAVGTRVVNYVDTARMNRPVGVLLRYPAVPPGGADASALTGCPTQAPVFSFGHGFTISNSGYEYLALYLAAQGYIMVLPGTEAGLSPSHGVFAADLQFAARAVQSDPFFAGAAAPDRIYGGHSMGGGAAFLAAASDRNAHALFVLAPAQTNPSAIAAAVKVRASTFIVLGSRDCVTPRATNAQPMFDALNLSPSNKSIVEIPGASHCQFATGSVSCAIAEQSCGGAATITTASQQIEARTDAVEFLVALGFPSESIYFDDFE